MRRALGIGAAVLLYAAAAVHPTEQPRREPSDFLRELVRPFVLPRLWRELEDAMQRGDPTETVAIGRFLTRFLPDWVDGHAHFAWQLAVDVAGDLEDAQQRLDRLLTARRWLRERQQELAPRAPELAAELLMTEAFLVEHRSMTDPGVGSALRARTGKDATELAYEARTRALDLAPSESRREALAHLTLRMVSGALRMGDVDRAERYVDLARRRLAETPDRESARAALDALRRLGRLDGYLQAEDDAMLESMVDDPYLGEIAELLLSMRRGR